jgi:hypothetical protein
LQIKEEEKNSEQVAGKKKKQNNKNHCIKPLTINFMLPIKSLKENQQLKVVKIVNSTCKTFVT